MGVRSRLPVRWSPGLPAVIWSLLLAVASSQTATPTPSLTPSLSPSPASFCNIRTIAGTGTASSTGDGGQATSATMNRPFSMLVNGSSLLIAEDAGRRLRRLDTATGVITTYAGTGSSTGDFLGVAATSANVGRLTFASLLPNGDFAVGSYDRCTVVGIAAGTQVTYAVAGNDTCLTSGQAASSGVAANATAFGMVRGCVLWGSDGLFVASLGDHRVRLVNLTTGACA
jgi:hypothetical protein